MIGSESSPVPGGDGMKKFWRWMLVLGTVSMLLHGLNIAYVLHCSSRDGVRYFWGPDTDSYISNSEAMFDERPMSPLFRERLVYPFLLAAVKAAGMEHKDLLWLPVLLEVPAVLAMALLGWVVTRRRLVAALSALIYVANPNSYQIGMILMADSIHGQLLAGALALLLHWALDGNRRSGVAAGVLISLAQMTRPTFFPMLAPLVLLLGKGIVSRDRRAVNLFLCACAVAYPAVNTAVNYSLYGVPKTLLTPGLAMQTCYVSMVRAMQRNAEHPGSMTQLYFDEKHNVALVDPRQLAIDSYGNSPIRPDFASNYYSIVRTSEEFLHANLPLWIEAGFNGVRKQLFHPPRFEPDPRSSHLYPDLTAVARKLHGVALFFSFCGVMLLIRRLDIRVTLFYACWTALIAMACTACWHDSVRVRILLDIIYTPVLAVGLTSIPAWLCFGSLGIFAYLPRRVFHCSPAFMATMTALVMAASAVFLARISGPEGKKELER